MAFPILPDILKNANWQKEKGKLAKLFAKKTGIGEQMNKIKAGLDKLDGANLGDSGTYGSMAALEAHLAACKKELAKTEPVRKECYALRDLAKDVAGQFKKNKLIPSASSAHLEAVAKAADLYGVTIKSYDPTKDFESARANIRVREEAVKKLLTGQLANCATALKTLKGGKATPEDYEEKGLQAFRGLGAQVAKMPHLKPVQSDWKTLTTVQKVDLAGPKEVEAHLGKLEALVKKTVPLIG